MDRSGIFAGGDPFALARSWLSEAPEMEVVGHAGTGQAVLERLEEGPVDLILMEVSLPGRDGIDTMREVRRHHPAVKVLAYSALTEIEYVNSMLIEGASGYLVKGSSKEELITAIRAVMNDQPYLSPAARESTLHGSDRHPEKYPLVGIVGGKCRGEFCSVKYGTLPDHGKATRYHLQSRSPGGDHGARRTVPLCRRTSQPR